jgi:hypothetical protein
MYERVLWRMREKVRTLQYVVTAHAEEEMSDDDLTILDLEHAILSGRILQRQRDAEAGGWKYVVGGPTLIDDPMELVGRLSASGKLVIVTVYRA